MDCSIQNVPKNGPFGDQTYLRKKVFDKHKSWYKLDIDGDFITKTEPMPKKMVGQKPVLSIYMRPRNVQPKTSTIYPEQTVAPPRDISHVHELAMKLAVNVGMFLLFILSSLCGVSYLWPVRVAKSKTPKVKGIF